MKTTANTTVSDDYVDVPIAIVANALYAPAPVTPAEVGKNGARLTIIAHSILSPSLVFEEKPHTITYAYGNIFCDKSDHVKTQPPLILDYLMS